MTRANEYYHVRILVLCNKVESIDFESGYFFTYCMQFRGHECFSHTLVSISTSHENPKHILLFSKLRVDHFEEYAVIVFFFIFLNAIPI